MTGLFKGAVRKNDLLTATPVFYAARTGATIANS
jgi:hypothetical protein